MKKTLIFMSLLFSVYVNAGDAELGKAKAVDCTACHNTDGNSTNPIWPKLAGQHEEYTARQLSLFKNGQREGAVMASMAANLNENDIQNLATYYANQKPSIGSADENLIEAGKTIYQGGIAKMKIPACMACHGVSGKGNPLSGYPMLSGQHAAYTEQRLKDFRAGKTVQNKDDINGNIMADVSKYLSDEEIKAVSSYIQGLYSN